MNKTSIEWTHRPETRGEAGGMTWNPIRARYVNAPRLGDNGGKIVRPNSGTFCTRISPGCTNCYASTINKRFGNGLEFTVPNLEKVEFFIDDRILREPLQQKKPCTIFVGDMFDLFHEAIPDSLIEPVVAIAAYADWHTFQFLTKRADRMRSHFRQLSAVEWTHSRGRLHPWPFENIWLGVSVESQKYADERIPLLLQTPAAVRFLSVEPQLEEIDFEPESIDGMPTVNMLTGADWCDPPIPGIDWVIVGGESGPGARPFNLAWAELVLRQCRAAGVPFFMKQVGSNPHGKTTQETIPMQRLKDRKGGDPSEWPESLRVREFPVVREVVTA